MWTAKLLRNRDFPFRPVHLQIAGYGVCLPFGSFAHGFIAQMSLRIMIGAGSVAALASLSWFVVHPTCATRIEACFASSSLPEVWMGIGCTGSLLGTLALPVA